jgi:hypothetical protein
MRSSAEAEKNDRVAALPVWQPCESDILRIVGLRLRLNPTYGLSIYDLAPF